MFSRSGRESIGSRVRRARPRRGSAEPIRPDVLLMEGCQYLTNIIDDREIFPSGEFRLRGREGSGRSVRLLRSGKDTVEGPRLLGRPRAGLQEGVSHRIRGDQGAGRSPRQRLIEVSATGAGGRCRSRPASARRRSRSDARFDAIRMALWGAAAAAAAVWIFRGPSPGGRSGLRGVGRFLLCGRRAR